MRISRESLKERVKQQLLERLMNGFYPPGERLVETVLAEEFGTSPIPVREALLELTAMRLVDSESYKGVRVRSFSNREIREAYEVRAVLEEFAAKRAARVLKGDTKSLRHLLRQMVEAARKNDFKAYLNSDLPFHRLIVAASGNTHLLRTWDELGFQIRANLFLTRDNSDLLEIAHLHPPIVEALDAGDGRRAATLLRDHSQKFAEELTSMEANELRHQPANALANI